MHMKTHFSAISSYRDLSLSDFLKLASLMCIYVYKWVKITMENFAKILYILNAL